MGNLHGIVWKSKQDTGRTVSLSLSLSLKMEGFEPVVLIQTVDTESFSLTVGSTHWVPDCYARLPCLIIGLIMVVIPLEFHYSASGVSFLHIRPVSLAIVIGAAFSVKEIWLLRNDDL